MIRRVAWSLTADDRGAFAPVRLSPFTGVLLAIVTIPADELVDRFDVSLVDTDGCDVLGGSGHDRSGRVEERSMVRLEPHVDCHPYVAASDGLSLHVSGTHPPGASLTVELWLAVD